MGTAAAAHPPRAGGTHSRACERSIRSSREQVRTPKRPVTSHAAQKNRDSPRTRDEEPRVDIPGAGGRERATGGTEQASEHEVPLSVRVARTNPADQQALTPSRTVAGADEGPHQTLATRRKERRGRPTQRTLALTAQLTPAHHAQTRPGHCRTVPEGDESRSELRGRRKPPARRAA